MPQASDELQAKMRGYFDDSIMEHGPETFLRENGWIMTQLGFWRSPKPIKDISEKEYECIEFLIDEWDHSFAGVINATR